MASRTAHLEPIFTREVVATGGDDRAVRRAARRGDLVPLHRGVFADPLEWAAVRPRDRYRHRVEAAALAMRGEPVLSHQSAAAAWGIPLVGRDPQHVHVLTTPANGTRTQGGVRRHASHALDDRIIRREGIALTDLERTLVDLGAMLPFAQSVAALDWGIRPSTRRNPKPVTSARAVLDCAAELGVTRGARRLERALRFADGMAESAGESVSRAVIHELGFPPPSLQVEFRDRLGFIGRVDFFWPEWNLIGEFDGLIKYSRDLSDDGRSPEQRVVDEKRREDRLRRVGPAVARWVWDEVRDRSRLAAILDDAGLPRRIHVRSGR